MSDTGRLAARAMSCLLAIQRLNESISQNQINDYGDLTGFCDEYDDIWDGLYDHLGRVTARANRTTRRISKSQQQITGDNQP